MPRKNQYRFAIIMVIIVISSGIYIHNDLNSFIKSPVLFYQEQAAGHSAVNNDTEADQPGNSANQSRQSSSDSQSQQKAGSIKMNAEKSVDNSLEANLEQKAGQPIGKLDILKASLILIRKLGPEDIQYLRQAAQKDAYTQEDYERSREILKKLSPEDISMLKQIGKKYGKDLSFLNQSKSS